ncbi:MAG: baseplate J/gp47 family protein [Anaerolineae bacterium]|nr:baseplate J/gp47 family protein [Thermoflexales bacterium]MDW8406642.1 baseplate J/gp47 family protein [Anaerolineae bacterium]
MIGKIIYVSPYDDAVGIRDRIAWACADRADAMRIALVMEPAIEEHDAGAAPTLYLRELDYALIKRAGDQHGVEIAVVHPDYRQRQMARQVGLVAFKHVQDATQKAWLPPEEVEPIRRRVPPRRFVPDSLRRFFPARNWLLIGVRILLALLALGMVGASVGLMVPSAQITLTASSQRISTIVPVSLDRQASRPNAAARIVPAQRIDVIVEDRFTTPATGAKDVPRTKAVGTVTFFNVLATPYRVPKNTVVRTSSASVAVRFVTLRDIEVPGGGRVDAPIEALEPGPGSNVPANQINRVEGMPALAVRVINREPTRGGANETVRAVTEADYRRARNALRDKLVMQALDKMRQDPDVINNGLFVVPDTIFIADVQDETYDRFITEQADQVTLNMRLQMAGLAVSPAHLAEVAREALATKVPAGFSLLSVEVERGDVAEEGTGTNTVFFMVAKGIAGAEIAENAVKRAVRGKPIGEAQSILLETFALRSNPVIQIEPSWWRQSVGRLPFVTLRISVQVRRE